MDILSVTIPAQKAVAGEAVAQIVDARTGPVAVALPPSQSTQSVRKASSAPQCDSADPHSADKEGLAFIWPHRRLRAAA